MRLLANGLITSRIRYDATSYTAYRLDANLSPPQLQDWLVLPAGFNPRTIQFAQELRDQVLPGAATDRRAQEVQLVNAVLEHFRRGSYGYTLEHRPWDATRSTSSCSTRGSDSASTMPRPSCS